MFWARFRPILVKKLFNVFAISNLFVISMAFILSLSFVGRGSLVLFLDKMSFNVFHVFLISCLNFWNVISKYNVLAVRMLHFNMLLYFFRLMSKVLCSIVFGCNCFSLAYNLSRERIDYFNNPRVIHLDLLCLYLLNLINLHGMCLFLKFTLHQLHNASVSFVVVVLKALVSSLLVGRGLIHWVSHPCHSSQCQLYRNGSKSFSRSTKTSVIHSLPLKSRPDAWWPSESIPSVVLRPFPGFIGFV